MMIIVGDPAPDRRLRVRRDLGGQTGQGLTLRVMILLVLITAVASAFLDNVTTVLLIAPVTLLVCDRLGISPVPFLITEVLASNLGGTSTLIGDPPNIIIASRSGLSFNDFLLNLAPIAALAMAVFIAMLPVLFRGSFHVDPDRVADVMALNEREAIKDRRLLIICGIVLAAVFTGFIGHAVLPRRALGRRPARGRACWCCCRAASHATSCPASSGRRCCSSPACSSWSAPWPRPVSSASSPSAAADATGGDAFTAAMLILFVSALLSGIIDNIPYVAAMSPIVLELDRRHRGPDQADALWWALAIGADFGGNLTAIGASANVVVLGIAKRSGYPDLVLGVHQKGRHRHRDHDRARRTVPVAALLRLAG